jgi:hypothetical protein
MTHENNNLFGGLNILPRGLVFGQVIHVLLELGFPTFEPSTLFLLPGPTRSTAALVPAVFLSWSGFVGGSVLSLRRFPIVFRQIFF